MLQMCIRDRYTTALGTQSSAATIPVNLQCAETDGVCEQIRNFVVPLCANIHICLLYTSRSAEYYDRGASFKRKRTL